MSQSKLGDCWVNQKEEADEYKEGGSERKHIPIVFFCNSILPPYFFLDSGACSSTLIDLPPASMEFSH